MGDVGDVAVVVGGVDDGYYCFCDVVDVVVDVVDVAMTFPHHHHHVVDDDDDVVVGVVVVVFDVEKRMLLIPRTRLKS